MIEGEQEAWVVTTDPDNIIMEIQPTCYDTYIRTCTTYKAPDCSASDLLT